MKVAFIFLACLIAASTQLVDQDSPQKKACIASCRREIKTKSFLTQCLKHCSARRARILGLNLSGRRLKQVPCKDADKMCRWSCKKHSKPKTKPFKKCYAMCAEHLNCRELNVVIKKKSRKPTGHE